MAFESFFDVDNWLARPGNTIGVLRGHVTTGKMSGENARWAKAWIEQYDAMSEAGRRDREIALQQLALDEATKHAKQQIAVAERAASAAERSARYTMWASVAAAVAALAAVAGVAMPLSNKNELASPPQVTAPLPASSAPSSSATSTQK